MASPAAAVVTEAVLMMPCALPFANLTATAAAHSGQTLAAAAAAPAAAAAAVVCLGSSARLTTPILFKPSAAVLFCEPADVPCVPNVYTGAVGRTAAAGE